jgi:hypothetical protein
MSKESDNVSLLLRKSMTLRELIDMSQESRTNQKSLPDSLAGKIKVKPITNKRRNLDHLADFQFNNDQKLFNQGRNMIIPAIPQKPSGQGENSKSFKEKLTDFIM